MEPTPTGAWFPDRLRRIAPQLVLPDRRSGLAPLHPRRFCHLQDWRVQTTPVSPPTPASAVIPPAFSSSPAALVRATTTFQLLSRRQPAFSYPRSSRNRPAHARGVSRCPASHYRTPARGDKLNEDPYSEVAPGHHPNATPSSSTFGEQRRGLSDAVRSPAQSSSSPSSPQDRLL